MRSAAAQAMLDEARWLLAYEAQLDADAAHAEYRRGITAMRLARDLTTYRALMAGQPVHPARLDAEVLARLRAEGLKL